MPRLTLLALWAWLGLLSLAAAQTPLDRPDLALPPPPLPPYPLPRDPELPLQPVTLPAEEPSASNWQYVAPAAADSTAKAPSTDRVHHLRQAADHLEAAGLVEQAIELRKQAAKLDSVLAQKLQQLKQLQAEIDRLSKTPPAKNAAQIQLKVRILQVSPQKLRAAADAAAVNGEVVMPSQRVMAQANAFFALGLQPPGEVDNALAKLRKSGAIKVLAEPTLVTVSGRDVSFWMGQEHPAIVPSGKDQSAVTFQKAGIQLDMLPVLCRDAFIRLEVRPRITTLEPGRSVRIGDQNIPGLRTREIDTGVEIRLGQTLIVGFLAQPPATAKDVRQAGTASDEKTEQEIVILVTPTLLETGTGPSASQTPAADKTHDSWWGRWWRQ